MRQELMKILACPVCKRELGLTVSEEKEGEIVSGSLLCDLCAERYPIDDCIPDLTPPDLR